MRITFLRLSPPQRLLLVNTSVRKKRGKRERWRQKTGALGTHYYKLPFVGLFSSIAQCRISRLTQHFCKNLDIKLVFTPYKIKNLFRVKDAIPKTLRSRVVYKFSCAGCSACYVGETNRHLATCVREHLTSDKNSHIMTN